MKTKFVVFSLAVVSMSIMSMAQTTANKGKGVVANRTNTTCSAYVDNNKNGICDNYEARHANGAVGRGNGQGKGRGFGQGRGQGPNYVDKNQNGICDYRETVIKK